MRAKAGELPATPRSLARSLCFIFARCRLLAHSPGRIISVSAPSAPSPFIIIHLPPIPRGGWRPWQWHRCGPFAFRRRPSEFGFRVRKMSLQSGRQEAGPRKRGHISHRSSLSQSDGSLSSGLRRWALALRPVDQLQTRAALCSLSRLAHGRHGESAHRAESKCSSAIDFKKLSEDRFWVAALP